jgi:hypothetical protein
MSAEHLGTQARRVVSGVNQDGKSTIITDEITTVRAALPAFTCNDVWRVSHVPTSFDDDALGEEFKFNPPAAGIIVRLVTFPPDSEVGESAYDDTIDQLMGPEFTAGHEQAVGMHAMATVDIDTIISGEIYCVFETGEETLLRAGDTVINRGTTHAWSNRTDKPVTLVATIVPVGQ